MGTLGVCCCGDCCLTAEEMTLTTVELIAPIDDCEGGLGGGGGPGGGVGAGVGDPDPEIEYPSASFAPSLCCFTADFNLGCQEYTEHCGLYASQDVNFSYQSDIYKSKASYLDEPGEHDCPCVKIQTREVTYDGTGNIYWAARYKLTQIKIHIGKVNVVCSGSETPVCKYYLAATYQFEFCEVVLPVLEYVLDIVATGHYKVDQCSTTETIQTTSQINSCQDLLDADPWASCNSSTNFRTTRIKLFDTLPTGTISITDADYPPFSVGGSSGCLLQSQPCAINVVDNCVANLPTYNGLPPSTYWFCTPVGDNTPPLDTEGCFIDGGCPEVEEKSAITIDCEHFEYNAQVGCYELKGWASQEYPGIDLFYCGYCTIDGVTTRYYTELFGTYFTEWLYPDLCDTGACCFDGFDAGFPLPLYNCKEFNTNVLNQEDARTCRADIIDFTCAIGELQTYETGAFCFNLPTVTVRLS